MWAPTPIDDEHQRVPPASFQLALHNLHVDKMILDFPDVISSNGLNSDSEISHLTEIVTLKKIYPLF